MKISTKNIVTASLLLLAGALHAQNFKALVREMRSDYAQSKTLHIVMEIAVYDSARAQQPYHRQGVEIKRDGNNYWYHVGEIEMLMNEKYLIVANKESRQITCSNRSVEAEAQLQTGYQFDLDSIFMQYEEPQFLGKTEDADHYRVTDKKGPISEVHFYIIPDSKIIKKIAYQYRDGQYASIRFLLFDTKARFGIDTFSEDRYVTKVNGKLVPSAYFRQYDLNFQ